MRDHLEALDEFEPQQRTKSTGPSQPGTLTVDDLLAGLEVTVPWTWS